MSLGFACPNTTNWLCHVQDVCIIVDIERTFVCDVTNMSVLARPIVGDTKDQETLKNTVCYKQLTCRLRYPGWKRT